MIYEKKSVSRIGNFAKNGEDIKDGDILEIRNEGVVDEGKWGPKDVFLVKLTNGDEKNINVNQTSINKLIDAYGADSASWVGKKVKAWVNREMVSGNLRYVLYLTHPDKSLEDDDEPMPTAPANDGAPAPTDPDEVNPEDIPF